MSLATTIALLAAAFKPKPDRWEVERARLLARCVELEAESARLRRDVAAAQMLLAEAQRLAAAPPGVGQVNLANWQGHQMLGAQTLALDAEFWRNCTPSRADILTARR